MRNYKWEMPIRALRDLIEDPANQRDGRRWFTSGDISERIEQMGFRWEVSQRSVGRTMPKHMKDGKVLGRRVRQKTFSQAKVEVWEWSLSESL